MDGSAFCPEFLQQLPPGFRFHPTDEELLIHYLKNKVSCSPLPASIIAEIDVYKHDPWDLPAKASFGEQEWYFFSPRDRKYPNGSRPNRSAGSGYWKATGTEKPISVMSGTMSSQIVGVKKALVFFKGRPAKGLKTSWIMHEYRLTETMPTKRKRSLRLDDWVLCRIYKKATHSTRVFSNPELQAPSPADVPQESVMPNHSTRVFSNPELQAPSPADVPQESVMPKFSSFSGLFQSEDLFVDSFPSQDMSDASNAALSYVDPSSSLQVLPQHLNSCETRSHVSMSLGFNCDEASSVYPAKRQNSGNQSSTLQFECWNPYMEVSAPDEHMYHWSINENCNLDLLPWERVVIL
eukprot:PITA_25711